MKKKPEIIDAQFEVIEPSAEKPPRDWGQIAHIVVTVILTITFLQLVVSPIAYGFSDWLIYEVIGARRSAAGG